MPGCLAWIVRRAIRRIIGLPRTMADIQELQMKAEEVLITVALRAGIAINPRYIRTPVLPAMIATSRTMMEGEVVMTIRI